MKHIAFGDTGGHFRQLQSALFEIGMTEDYVLPEDIQIIHLGDLVHKGLYSTQTLQMIDDIRILNSGQWTQIIGNHEAQYLGGYLFWNKKVDKKGQSLLNEWYADGFLKFTHTIEATGNAPAYLNTDDKKYVLKDPVVFSHAGVSQPFWESFLKNANPLEFEQRIDDLSAQNVHKPGLMLGEQFNPNAPVGPVWAHGVHEVWTLWKRLDNISFNQIVGHIAPYQFNRKAFFPGTLAGFKKVANLHERERLTIVPLNKLNTKWMGFMDPGYSKSADTEIQPYLEIITEV